MSQPTWRGSERRQSPLFTIVTPVFNGMPWLPEAIESVPSREMSVRLQTPGLSVVTCPTA